MPSSAFESLHGGGSHLWSDEEVAHVPLPGPTLVIDVRPCEDLFAFEPMALLVYLWTEIHDLASEMRQHGIEGWSGLQHFLGFRKVNAGVDEYLLTDPRTWEPGQEPVVCAAAQLAPLLGALVNDLRNQRKKLARADDPSQATVRVIFVVDLDDVPPEQETSYARVIGRVHPDQSITSFDLAVTCANALKEWLHEEQGLLSDDEGALTEQDWPHVTAGPMVETVAVCLNMRTRQHYRRLTEDNAVRALDMLILVQPYRSGDNSHLDTHAQISHVELMLSALLLHWPVAMQARVEDQLFKPGTTRVPPRPVYMLGATAIEHATRWGERWWDYGLETALLEQWLAHEPVERQAVWLQSEVDRWWHTWRRHVQRTLAKLRGHVWQLDGLNKLGGLSQPDLFQARSLADLKQCVETFFAYIQHLYNEQGGGSLHDVLMSAPLLVELGKRIRKPPEMAPGVWQREIEDMRLPEREAIVYLQALFVQAQGSIPRALRQLQLLEVHSERLRLEISQYNISASWHEWEDWLFQARQRLDALMQGSRRFAWREKRLVQKERDVLLKSVQELQQRQYAAIWNVVCAHYQLALLEQADLPKPYETRLQALQHFLERVHERSRFLRDAAGERLALGSAQPLASAALSARPATVLNRQDHLNQAALLWHFKRAWEALHQEEASSSTKFLAQATLRFLGAEERSNNGHVPQPSYSIDEQQAQEHFHFLELLLVSAFLATKGGASIASFTPLLSNYHQERLRLQPDPNLLIQTIREMEETVHIVSFHQKIHGDGLPTLVWQVPDELPLAALIAGQPREPAVAALFAPASLLRFLEREQERATELLRTLDKQSELTGSPDVVSGEETCYLYLPVGCAGESFEHALDQQLQSTVHIVRTPNVERMIYLRIHRIHRFPGK